MNCSFPSWWIIGSENEWSTNILHPRWSNDMWLNAERSIGSPLFPIWGFAEKYLYIRGCKNGTRQSAKTKTFKANMGTNTLSPSLNWFQYLFISCRIQPAFGTFNDHVLKMSSAWLLRWAIFCAAAFLIFSYCQIAAPENDSAVNPIVNMKGRLSTPQRTTFSFSFPIGGISFCPTSGPDFFPEDSDT